MLFAAIDLLWIASSGSNNRGGWEIGAVLAGAYPEIAAAPISSRPQWDAMELGVGSAQSGEPAILSRNDIPNVIDQIKAMPNNKRVGRHPLSMSLPGSLGS